MAEEDAESACGGRRDWRLKRLAGGDMDGMLRVAQHLRDIASVFWREGSPRLLRMASCCAPGAPTMLEEEGGPRGWGALSRRIYTSKC
jgi:hypothetical protein